MRRRKLDPWLESIRFLKFDCEKDNIAFNLNLVSELAPLQDGGALSSELMPLENSANNFERGMVDDFLVECANLGTKIKEVDIGHDAFGRNAQPALIDRQGLTTIH